MAFVVNPNITFQHPVKVASPVDGGWKDEDFKATFRLAGDDELNDLTLSQSADSQRFMDLVVVSLDDLLDANNQPLPWNDEVRREVLKMPHVRKALARTYFEAIQGVRIKN